jgi:hypothetical protein
LVGLDLVQWFGFGNFPTAFLPSGGLFCGFDFLNKCIPFAAARTFSDPFGAFESAGFAKKCSFGFGHGRCCVNYPRLIVKNASIQRNKHGKSVKVSLIL